MPNQAAEITRAGLALATQLLELVGTEEAARAMLTEAARARANLAADSLELAKFDPATGLPRGEP